MDAHGVGTFRRHFIVLFEFILTLGPSRRFTSVIHFGDLPRRFSGPKESLPAPQWLRTLAPVPSEGRQHFIDVHFVSVAGVAVYAKPLSVAAISKRRRICCADPLLVGGGFFAFGLDFATVTVFERLSIVGNLNHIWSFKEVLNHIWSFQTSDVETS